MNLDQALSEARRICAHNSARRDGVVLAEILPVLVIEIERLKKESAAHWNLARTNGEDAGRLAAKLAQRAADEPTGVYREGYEQARAETITQVVAFLRSRCRHDAAADVERFEEERLKSSRVPEPIMAEIRALAAKDTAIDRACENASAKVDAFLCPPSPDVQIVPVSGELKALLIEHPTWDIARAQDELDHRKRLDVCLTCGGDHANHTTGKIR